MIFVIFVGWVYLFKFLLVICLLKVTIVVVNGLILYQMMIIFIELYQYYG